MMMKTQRNSQPIVGQTLMQAGRAARRAWVLPGAALAIALSGCSAPATAGPPAPSASPDLAIGAAQYPEDDAVVLRRERQWRIDADGAVHRREHYWVKLLNRRPIRRYADPRIDFNADTDTVKIYQARTHLPDGTILPVPEYSFNIASPNDVAGWPEYAAWRQRIVSFSGIVDDCVLELDYEVTTEPGVLPWISADLRLQEGDPVVQQIVSVTAPKSVAVLHRLDGVEAPNQPARSEDVNGVVTLRWTFENLPGARNEEQSPPWQERCGRLRFTTCPDAVTWTNKALTGAAHATEPDDAITAFAHDAVEEEPDLSRRLDKLAGALRGTFNFIDSPKTVRKMSCRPAADVFRSNYGSPLESGALLLAACRALSLKAYPVLAVDGRFFDADVPTDSGLVGVAAVIETKDGPLYVHPRHGVFHDPGSWGRHILLSLNDRGELEQTYIRARGEDLTSELSCTGRIELAEDGTAAGTIYVTMTGAFFDPTDLETGKAQQRKVESLVDRMLSGFKVTEASVTALSQDEFSATAQISTAEALPKIDDQRLLTLGDGPAFLADFPLPTDRSQRLTAVKLAGAFSEHIDLTVVLPDGKELRLMPASLPEVSGRWGAISQTVTRNGPEIHLQRDARVTIDRISPEEFPPIREAVNALRAPGCLHLAYGL
jgi:hypothetical protein